MRCLRQAITTGVQGFRAVGAQPPLPEKKAGTPRRAPAFQSGPQPGRALTQTAAYGHMGRESKVVTKTFKSPDGKVIEQEVELFTWEKLDYVDQVKAKFGL